VVVSTALGEIKVRFSLFSFLLGVGVYWGVQHFTGIGNTGRAKGA